MLPSPFYNGEKGEQGDKGDPGVAGSTPTISITQQADGNWYWTLNGTLMKDASGNPIRANGQDGEDGQPGKNAPTPMLKNGQALTDAGIAGTWIPDAIYLSIDIGKNWTQVSGRNGTGGKDGDSFLSGVDTSSEDYVTFTLAVGGAEIKVPRYKDLALSFSYTPPGSTGTETTIDPVHDILMILTSLDASLVIKYDIIGKEI